MSVDRRACRPCTNPQGSSPALYELRYSGGGVESLLEARPPTQGQLVLHEMPRNVYLKSRSCYTWTCVSDPSIECKGRRMGFLSRRQAQNEGVPGCASMVILWKHYS